jgi:hypothetical protein
MAKLDRNTIAILTHYQVGIMTLGLCDKGEPIKQLLTMLTSESFSELGHIAMFQNNVTIY